MNEISAPPPAQHFEPAPVTETYRPEPVETAPVHVPPPPVYAPPPMEARVVETPRRAPVAAPAEPAAGKAPFQPLSFDTDLQQVETKPGARVSTGIEEAPRAPRPPRQRPVRPPIADEPLQQVETRGK
jgi:hypothetical protein